MGEILAKQIRVSTPQQEMRRKLTTGHLMSELMAARFKQRVNGRSSDWWNFGNRNRQEKLTLCQQLLGMSNREMPASHHKFEDYRDRAELITGTSLRKALAVVFQSYCRMGVLLRNSASRSVRFCASTVLLCCVASSAARCPNSIALSYCPISA